jgi:NAD(P)-dependent dehydrogenase (short-subunit alcohol dehydrogenase family)
MQAFLPLLGAMSLPSGQPGRIINMSSISGKYGAPYVSAYCASKYGLEGMSDSLRRELTLFGIYLIVIGEEQLH